MRTTRTSSISARPGAAAWASPGGLPRAGGGLGILGVVIFLAIQLLGGGSGSSVALGPQTVPGAPQAEAGLRDFSVYVFHDTQDFWAGQVQGYPQTLAVGWPDGMLEKSRGDVLPAATPSASSIANPAARLVMQRGVELQAGGSGFASTTPALSVARSRRARTIAAALLGVHPPGHRFAGIAEIEPGEHIQVR